MKRFVCMGLGSDDDEGEEQWESEVDCVCWDFLKNEKF